MPRLFYQDKAMHCSTTSSPNTRLMSASFSYIRPSSCMLFKLGMAHALTDRSRQAAANSPRLPSSLPRLGYNSTPLTKP